MKKITNFLACIGIFAILLSLCSWGQCNQPTNEPIRDARYLGPKNAVIKNEIEIDGSSVIEEYKLNGHYYIYAVSYRGGVFVIHSPNCGCEFNRARN